MIRMTALALAAVVAVLQPGSASAAISPRVGMDEASEPRANFALSFSVPVDPLRSTAKVFGPEGEVPTGVLTPGANRAELVVPLRADLPPGTYVVIFTAISTMGVEMRGKTSVTIDASESVLPSLAVTEPK